MNWIICNDEIQPYVINLINVDEIRSEINRDSIAFIKNGSIIGRIVFEDKQLRDMAFVELMEAIGAILSNTAIKSAALLAYEKIMSGGSEGSVC